MHTPIVKFLPGLLLLALAVPGGAQTPSSPWMPWIGCWTPIGAGSAAVTCVVPGGTSASVDLLTVVNGAITRRTTIDANGTSRPVDADGCQGWEAARFSLDGDRVLLSAEITCGQARPQATSGILSVSSTGDWIDVQGVRVGDQRSLTIRRFRAIPDLERMPEEVRTALLPMVRVAGGARIAAGAPLDLADIVEVGQAVDEVVSEAWLVETHREAPFRTPVTAQGLIALDEAKVPTRVIDMVVALAHPDAFTVALGPDGGGSVQVANDLGGLARVGGSGGGFSAFDAPPWYYGGYGWYMPACAYAMTPGSPAFGFGRSLACAPMSYYSLFGPSWYWGGGWSFAPPLTVVVRPQNPPPDGGGGGVAPRGRVVRGRGYTQQTGTGTDEPAQPRSTTGSSTSSAGSAGGSRGSSNSGGATTGSGSSTNSGSSGRTAKPRNP